MPEQKQSDLLYDPMPRQDVKFPPLTEPPTTREEAKILETPKPSEDVSDLLSNLSSG